MLELIEKLRELRDAVEANDVDNPIWVCHKAEIIADEIEREIAEKYMPLPVDADGVPWTTNDKYFEYEGKHELYAMNYVVANEAGSAWKWSLSGRNAQGLVGEWQADECYHIKQRTIEDVLQDRINDALSTFAAGGLMVPLEAVLNDSFGQECADELRELLGGDAE